MSSALIGDHLHSILPTLRKSWIYLLSVYIILRLLKGCVKYLKQLVLIKNDGIIKIVYLSKFVYTKQYEAPLRNWLITIFGNNFDGGVKLRTVTYVWLVHFRGDTYKNRAFLRLRPLDSKLVIKSIKQPHTAGTSFALGPRRVFCTYRWRCVKEAER